MFKPRKAPAAVPATPPAIEVVRQRAKHRLMGASVLVLAGVVVFPLLFDTQPRPIPVDVPIEIPSRQAAKNQGKVTPAVAEPVVTERSLSQSEEVVESSAKPLPVPADALSDEEVVPARPVSPPPQTAVAAPAAPAPKKAVPPAPTAPAVVAKESARAQALLTGRDASTATQGSERFIVQVGAFAETAMAQQVRLKLERAGLKTYTHVADTPDGKRTRVRLGPFSSRTEAEKAAAKAKGLGISAAILTL